MIKKPNLADKHDFHVNSTDDFDAINIYIKDELDSANNLELNCNNFTINEESTILDDYDMYRSKKARKREKTQTITHKNNTLLEKEMILWLEQ